MAAKSRLKDIRRQTEREKQKKLPMCTIEAVKPEF